MSERQNRGFNDEETREIQTALNDLKQTLYDKVSLEKIAPLERAMQKNQEAINAMIGSNKLIKLNSGAENFGDAWARTLEQEFHNKQAEIKAFQNDKDAKLSFSLKTVGDMSISASLTGDGQASYSQRQGLVPAAKVNFRDLIPSVTSPTGLYVQYRETGGEGSVADQTEGNEKAQLDMDLTEVKTVSDYTAGWVRFSKQLMFVLPWLQSTLPRLLLRKFYAAENAKFYAAVAGTASGYDTTSETDRAKQIIDILMGRADADFSNSFILVKNSEKGAILKLLYENGFYMGSGSVVGAPDGTIRISDVPVIGVSWADANSFMVIDRDFIERVETEALRIDFSYEDGDNFRKNKVTARIECFEDINLIRLDAHSYFSDQS